MKKLRDLEVQKIRNAWNSPVPSLFFLKNKEIFAEIYITKLFLKLVQLDFGYVYAVIVTQWIARIAD